MGEWCSHAPTKLCGANITFAEPYAQYPQTQQSVAIIGGYAVRNMQNVAAIQSNAAQLGEGNANIAYELGRLHLVPPDQFVGGDVQTYYEQGYNYQDYVVNMASYAISSSLILVIHDNMIIGTNHIVLACLCRHL
jgi:hypothetical protein